eukprot:321059-Pyramimonas_sp.AAC.1
MCIRDSMTSSPSLPSWWRAGVSIGCRSEPARIPFEFERYSGGFRSSYVEAIRNQSKVSEIDRDRDDGEEGEGRRPPRRRPQGT